MKSKDQKGLIFPPAIFVNCRMDKTIGYNDLELESPAKGIPLL
jgi:hypothetical protein